MPIQNIFATVCGCILCIFCAVAITIRIMKNRESSGDKMTLAEFFTEYLDNIIKTLQNTVVILEESMSSYDSREDYENSIISMTIDAIKENSTMLGIPDKYINMFSTEDLVKMITNIYRNKKVTIFSALSVESIKNNENIIDKEVVEVLSPAVEETENNKETDDSKSHDAEDLKEESTIGPNEIIEDTQKEFPDYYISAEPYAGGSEWPSTDYNDDGTSEDTPATTESNQENKPEEQE